MKRKDMIYLLVAVVVLLVAGYVAYTQLLPQKTSTTSGVVVEQVGAIPNKLSDSGITLLNDTSKVQDYRPPVDLSGLGNAAPFGP